MPAWPQEERRAGSWLAQPRAPRSDFFSLILDLGKCLSWKGTTQSEFGEPKGPLLPPRAAPFQGCLGLDSYQQCPVLARPGWAFPAGSSSECLVLALAWQILGLSCGLEQDQNHMVLASACPSGSPQIGGGAESHAWPLVFRS